MILSERISRLVEYSKLSIPRFAAFVGFKTPQAVRELIKGNTKTLSDAAIIKLSSAFPELNVDWLTTGEGDMLREEVAEPMGVEPLEPGVRLVPLINIDSVGGIHSNNILNPDEQYIIRRIPFTDAREGDVAIYQSGTSMSPTIPPGSILHIRQVEGWQEYLGYGNLYVLLLADERRITKEIRRYDPDPRNYVLCVSYNDNAAPEELPRSFIRGVWKVIKVLADYGW